MRKKSQKILKPNRNFDFNSKQTSDTKLTQLSLHLETLIEHGINFRDRIVTLNSEIDSNTFSIIDAAMSEMEADNRKAITIRINSPGGTVYDALAIVGRLKVSKCKIVTEGYGHIMSCATLILACGDQRKISKFAWSMFHEASYEVDGAHKQIKDAVKQAEREEIQWAKWMSVYSKKDAKFWREIISGKDAYFSPDELLEFGVIDEII